MSKTRNLADVASGTITGDLSFSDNEKAIFGAGSDLEIYHNGSDNMIEGVANEYLFIKHDNLLVRDLGNKDQIRTAKDGAVTLYHNSGQRLVTTSTGVDVTGTVQADQYNNDEALPDIRPSLLLDFANSKTLDPRITFTRGSTATYWDGKTTGKAEENLLSYSQDLSNAAWLVSGTTVTANNTAAPDGTTTAEKVAISTEGDYRNISQRPTGLASTAYTLSVYLKKSNWDYVSVNLQSRTSSNGYINTFGQKIINLSNGTTIGNDIGTATTTDVGNGWYRVTVSGTSASNAEMIYIDFQFTNSSGQAAPSTSVANGSAIFLWGAQLEQRSAATAYTPTTSAPIVKYQPTLQTAASGEARFDHDPTTGESKGLLIEHARTNLFTYSVDYSHSNWNKNNSEVDDNVIIAPDGTLTGGLLKENTASGANQHNMSQAPTVTTQHYTMSAYFKEPTIHSRRYVGLTMWGMAYAGFDIQAGTTFNYGSGLTNQTITDVGNGWYYCTATWLKTNTNAGAYILLFNTSSGNSGHNYEVDGTKKGMHIWGAQLEAGSFPTSYIPTSGSTVTRAVDAAEITGSNLTYAISQTSGTLYGSGIANETGTGGSKPRLAVLHLASDTGINKNSISLQRNNGALEGGIYYNGVSQSYFFGDSNQLANYATGKAALGYELNSANLGSNGTIETTDTVVNAPYVDVLKIGSSGYGQSWNGTIDKIAIYPKRLSNATLQAMTTE